MWKSNFDKGDRPLISCEKVIHDDNNLKLQDVTFEDSGDLYNADVSDIHDDSTVVSILHIFMQRLNLFLHLLFNSFLQNNSVTNKKISFKDLHIN